MIGNVPSVRNVSAVRSMFFMPRRVARVESNSKEQTFEVDSHADTTCLGAGALKFYDFDCPVDVHGYDPALGSR